MHDIDVRGLLARVALGDHTAADGLDELADRLHALAAHLRASQGTHSTGGMSDRVQMQVVGPNGTIRQATDTNPPGAGP